MILLTIEQIAVLNSLMPLLGWLLLVIILDLILGVTIALKQRAFQWQRLADFLGDYGPKILGWLALELLGLLPTDLQTLAGLAQTLGHSAYTVLLISAIASVLGHIQALGIIPAQLPGVPTTQKSQQ